MLNKKMKRLVIIIIIGFLAVLLAIAGFNFYKQLTLKQAASTFVENILKNDSTKSYQQFSIAGQKSTDKIVWKNQVARFSQFFKGQVPKIETTSQQSGYQIVTMSISGSDKTPYIFTVSLTEKTLGWQVESFTSNPAT